MINRIIEDCIKTEDWKTAMIIIGEIVLRNETSLNKIENRLEELEKAITQKSEKKVEGITFG